jgi:hypothetical protein
MKSFKKFLTENELPAYTPVSINTDPHLGITTHHYVDEGTGVHSFIHTKNNIAYWGFQVTDNEGKLTDVAPKDVSQEMRRARLHTAFEHLANFAKNNPNVRDITYQTNEGERGEKNHSIFQAKWPVYQEKYGIHTPLTRVEKNPMRED